MYSVYVLKSLKNNKRYTGHTGKNIYVRLKEHNKGCNKWTRRNRPFKLIHLEKFGTKKQAIQQERFLKSGQGRKWLDKNFKNN